MRAIGYAASSATSDLAPIDIERRPLRTDDVLIEVAFCGVCHTDLHIARNHGGFTRYPVVPGHEVVGRVKAVGTDVSRFKIGDRVGVGCMVGSCGHCASCQDSAEQHCVEGATFTYNDVDRHDGRPTFGGYSQTMVAPERFVLSISQALDLAQAAPLLCAGITVWEPLKRWEVGQGTRLAVGGDLVIVGYMGPLTPPLPAGALVRGRKTVAGFPAATGRSSRFPRWSPATPSSPIRTIWRRRSTAA